MAKDLLKLDFSSPEEAPEEFRAVVFNAPPAKKGMRMPSLTALEIQTQGSNMSAYLCMSWKEARDLLAAAFARLLQEESDHESVTTVAEAQCLRIHGYTGMQHPWNKYLNVNTVLTILIIYIIN